MWFKIFDKIRIPPDSTKFKNRRFVFFCQCDYFCVMETMKLHIGLRGREETVVTEDLLARNVGSGLVKVYATAMMIALIEKAAVYSVEPYLEPGQGTVGTHVDVSHCSATPLGMKVWAETELVGIDRRKLIFRVAAYDERGLIGEGRHERFIIDNQKFQAKADAK